MFASNLSKVLPKSILALIHQNAQVAIDGAHAQVRKLLLQFVVHPVGSGVVSRALQQLENSFTLSAALVLARNATSREI